MDDESVRDGVVALAEALRHSTNGFSSPKPSLVRSPKKTAYATIYLLPDGVRGNVVYTLSSIYNAVQLCDELGQDQSFWNFLGNLGEERDRPAVKRLLEAAAHHSLPGSSQSARSLLDALVLALDIPAAVEFIHLTKSSALKKDLRVI